MTAADEFSMLDSGRTGTAAFDPMHLSSTASRSRMADFQQNFDPTAPREPPSLDMLAEMIKEEIRQASGLKQALDRVGFETNCIATRMSTLSMAESMDKECGEAKDHGDAKPGAQKRVNGKAKKQVRFVVPDDVRFRWLGIFQQPTESEDGSEPETPMPLKSRTSDAANHNNAPPAAASSSPPDRVASPPTSPDKALVNAHTDGQSEDLRSVSLVRMIAERSSLDNEVIDRNYVLLPFTANSSVEAVYGGSRSDTRESSMLNSGASMANSVRGRHAHGSRSTEALLDEKVARARLGRLLQIGEARYDKDAADEAPGVNGASHRGKYSTISGKNSRRIAAQLQQISHEHSDPGEPMRTHSPEMPATSRVNGRSAALSPPLTSRSAFAQPSLATSKVTVSKQHSVSPELAAAQMTQIAQNGPSKAGDMPPLVFRSGSAHEEVGNGVPPSSSRRRNSLDESSISSRGALRADLGSGSGDQLQASAVPPSPRRSQPSGLFRRVTTTAALRKHNQHNDYAHTGDGESNGDDVGGSGIIGGTREFFKHRLRSRTHSNSTHLLNGTSQAGSAQTNGASIPAKAGTDVAERPRKRSDAEVKSREPSVSPPPPLPQQPTLPDYIQRIPAADRRGVTKHSKNNVAAGVHHKLLPPRPPPSSSSSSGTQGDVFKTPQPIEALHSQRKSHDGAMTMAARGSDEHSPLGRSRARTSSADSARQHHHQHQSSTVRVARGHTEVSKQLRPTNGDTEEGIDSERFGTRSRSRRNTGESASSAPPHLQPQPPRKFTLNVGRGEQPTSANDDSDAVLDPPPVPKLPAGSPLPPLVAIISPQEVAKSMAGLADRRQHPAGDVDSIDYHLRRLRPSNNKGRRSSFMTTISNMLGRKD
ncbi:hypothetical protein GGH94_000306 [Coemansia aciculifera]|uniref:Uncharacterized protein n=1 Tax=Coemansia aciculifera TaxID=417176 RepID=A0A9W8M5Z3_9FUNG|nr:hypothetical protein GGH94_000306 [Coemansia aciculifera]KAJ2877077.1 hypothetical protein GGH93_000235 [Coemansia aciculifera]